MPELSKFYQWTDETIQSYRQQIIGLLKEKTNIFMDIDEHMVYEKMILLMIGSMLTNVWYLV